MNDPRTAPTAPKSCPHCFSTRTSVHHFRDAGDLDPAGAERLGYCPVLAGRRTNSTTLVLAPNDARLAARLDLAAEISADDYAELLALAVKASS